MKLRRLRLSDAGPMLEWMRDERINDYFRFNNRDVSIESCEKFIENSFTDEDRHYAIDDNGKYLGTISLKHIDHDNKTAEYAIALHRDARGKGVGTQASLRLLEIAFCELKLNRVYLDVFSDNQAAIGLYCKLGFVEEGELREHVIVNGRYRNLKLFGMLKEEYEKL